MGRREAIAILAAPLVRPAAAAFPQDTKQHVPIEDLEDTITIFGNFLNPNIILDGATAEDLEKVTRKYNVHINKVEELYQRVIFPELPFELKETTGAMANLSRNLLRLPQYLEENFYLSSYGLGVATSLEKAKRSISFSTNDPQAGHADEPRYLRIGNEVYGVGFLVELEVERKVIPLGLRDKIEFHGRIKLVDEYGISHPKYEFSRNSSLSWKEGGLYWEQTSDGTPSDLSAFVCSMKSRLAGQEVANVFMGRRDSNVQRYLQILQYTDPTKIMQYLNEALVGKILVFNEKGEWIKNPR